MLTWEFSVLDFIQTHLHSSTGDIVMPLISRLGDGGVVWIVLALVLLIYPKTRKTGAALMAARALAGLRETGLVTGSRGETLRVLADTEQIIRRRQEKASATVRDCIRQLKHLGYTSEEIKTLIFASI